MKNREDKIISIINDNVDIDLKENFQLINARKNESMTKNVRTKLHKKFSFGLAFSIVVIIILVVPVILVGMPAKKAFEKGDTGSNFNSMEPEDTIDSSLYTDKIVGEDKYSISWYAKGDYLSKQDMEVIFTKYHIDSEILEEVNSYTIIIGRGKNDNKEYLVYTNGVLVKEEEIKAGYSIYDIYLSINSKTNSNINFINIAVYNNDLVYYYCEDGKLYSEVR